MTTTCGACRAGGGAAHSVTAVSGRNITHVVDSSASRWLLRACDGAGPRPCDRERSGRAEHGDDGAVVRVSPAMAVVVTADFFTPVVDDAYTFGRIAATNALSDVYAMGGVPLVAVNLLGWPRDKLPAGLAAGVLRGGMDTGRAAGCYVVGGHSIDDPEPKYGMAVTGTADPAELLRIDAGRPGLPLSLTKPIGTGVLNAWHKATGQVSAAAIEVMTTLNASASRLALAAGIRCATDVTGFGLLGHLFKLARASGVTAVVDHAAVPLIEGTREAARAGTCPAGAAATSTGCARTPTPAG
jgi:selenide,water dikinase